MKNCFLGATRVWIDKHRRIRVPHFFRLSRPYSLGAFVSRDTPVFQELVICHSNNRNKHNKAYTFQFFRSYSTLRPTLPAFVLTSFSLQPHSYCWLVGAGDHIEVLSPASWERATVEAINDYLSGSAFFPRICRSSDLI